jgi:hypothetical protein
MGSPKNEVVQIEYQNPHAQGKLYMPMLVLCNTPPEDLERNIRHNSAKYANWLKLEKEHNGIAVMIGGGPSVSDYVDNIQDLQDSGAMVFAMNAASKWARLHEIKVDYQVIMDSKEETATLVDPLARNHLFASQCNPKTFEQVENPTLWHLDIGNAEEYFPPERVKKGGYVLIGGGGAVGNCATCVAYSQGFRELHIFGYDSSHKDNESHAYSQPMNDVIPTMEVEWGGKKFKTSITMKSQAERFQLTAQALKRKGVKLHLYGDGLLQTMYQTKVNDISEQQKYQLMWQYDIYRETSPGECVADEFINLVRPEPGSLIVDYGCGTGRAGIRFNSYGYRVLLLDFTDNCRDHEAMDFPFIQWDLTHPCPVVSDYGFCSDVMEHIPTKDVDKVIKNIMTSSKTVFFNISNIQDSMGGLIGEPLHLTVQPFEWWKQKFIELGFTVSWCEQRQTESCYVVHSTT